MTRPGPPPSPRPAPRRSGRGPGPFIVLGVVALVPALALLALFRWSDARVPADDAGEVPPTTLVAPPPPADPLVDPVMTYRRMPTMVSRGLSIEQFQDELIPFLGTLNDRSCVAVSVDGVPVGSQNPDLPVLPASALKVVVGAAALELLGADSTYTTTVVAASAPSGGVVEGDLVLVGGGDPLLSSDWYPTSNMERYPVSSPTSLDALADQVVAAGVTSVTGGVIGDGTRYDDEFFAPGWGSGVAGLEAGPYDALMANDARVLGEDLRASDPNAAAAREFARLLAERGVVVGGEAVSGSVAALGADPVELGAVESAPMSDVVAELLTNSDNNTAEMLVKEIGYQAGNGTRETGLARITELLATWGVDTTNIVLGDGSGLNLDTRLTCGALLAVLQHEDVDGPVGEGLPVAGRSGTLTDIFVGHPLEGVLTGKTGSLDNPPFNQDPPAVKALVGYVPVDGGGAIEYALVLNGPTISDQSEYRPVWGALADVLATYPAGPTPAELGLR